VIFFELLVTQPIFGQNGLSLGLHIIPQTTFLTESSNYYLNVERQNSLTLAGGISISYKFEKLQISSGFYYSKQKQKFTCHYETGSYYDYELKITLNYVEIPLTIDYDLFQKENTSLQIVMGFKLALLLNSNDNFIDVRYEDPYLPRPVYNTTYISSVVGPSFSYSLTKKLVLNSKLLLDFGLLNIFGDSEKVYPTDNEWVDFDFSRNIKCGLAFGLVYYFSNSNSYKCYDGFSPKLKFNKRLKRWKKRIK